MKAITELSEDKDFQALEVVLRKIITGKVVATVKQMITNGDKCEINDVQTAVAETHTFVDKNGDYMYITITNLNHASVKRIKNLWKMVLKRGTVRYKEGKENDYYMTIDCINVEERKQKSYLFGCFSTPIFCSSDGDEDLMLVVPESDCFISIDRYNDRDTDYEMLKQIENGKAISSFHDDKFNNVNDENDY